ncbi:VOC family protein [Amycolatopsis albispora]|uniref:Extradiol dioxygenase n=1 Tax=Amycolatopsis albispora TaxID=1804986 RepID=A0A344L3J5_9PSEU|nr:VOC family protein [Amycolatopsis albispora]AXB42619.1 extradiol dioxygenase [Amycolatopsis albispora]
MTSKTAAVNGVPAGYTAVTPWIISPDTGKLIEFATAAFGAEELFRVADEHGYIGHAEFKIGDAIVMAFDKRPDWPDTPAFLRLYVADCDATYERALAAGGRSFTRPTTAPFGDRVCRVLDPFGNLWWVHTRVEDVDPAELERRAADPEWVAAMEYLQSANLAERGR